VVGLTSNLVEGIHSTRARRVPLFRKLGQANRKLKYGGFLEKSVKRHRICIPIAEISPSYRKSGSLNPMALS